MEVVCLCYRFVIHSKEFRIVVKVEIRMESVAKNMDNLEDILDYIDIVDNLGE